MLEGSRRFLSIAVEAANQGSALEADRQSEDLVNFTLGQVLITC